VGALEPAAAPVVDIEVDHRDRAGRHQHLLRGRLLRVGFDPILFGNLL
jgi:hypothetical protein